jgi:hypothetical protein
MEDKLKEIVSRENKVKDLEENKREVCMLHASVEECAKKIDRTANYINLKERLQEQRAKELDSRENWIKKREKELEMKEEKVTLAQRSVEKQSEELEAKRKIIKEEENNWESAQKSTGKEEWVEPKTIDFVLALPCQNSPSDNGK